MGKNGKRTAMTMKLWMRKRKKRKKKRKNGKKKKMMKKMMKKWKKKRKKKRKNGKKKKKKSASCPVIARAALALMEFCSIDIYCYYWDATIALYGDDDFIPACKEA